MDSLWNQLYQEYMDLGQAHRGYHTLMDNTIVLESIQRYGIPTRHREWSWPILMYRQIIGLQLKSKSSYAEIINSLDIAKVMEVAMEKFDHLNQVQEEKIKRVMLAYTKSKHEFYYCHGMAEICVVLSTFLSEEDTYWSFRLLLEDLFPKYHEASILDFQVDCLVLQDLLNEYDPILNRHLHNIGITVQLLCTKWFFSFFAESMPFHVVCRLYDILFVDICRYHLGAKIVFATSLAILLYLSRYLVEFQDPSVMMELIVEFCFTTLQDPKIAEHFLDLVIFLHHQLEDEKIAKLRDRYQNVVKAEEEQFQADAVMTRQKATTSNADIQERARSNSRRGKSASIRLIIQWKDCEEASTESDWYAQTPTRIASCDDQMLDEDAENVAVEIVTTPTHIEMLEQLDQGIRKVNRRRCHSISKRASSREKNRWAAENTPHYLRTITDRDCKRQSMNEHSQWMLMQANSREKKPVVDQVRQMSSQGIPDEHRSWVWKLLLEDIPSYAENLKTLAQMEPEELDSEVYKAIETDISRTRDVRPRDMEAMRRILISFAARNRRVGYCQGMNEILVVLLRYLDHQQTLCALILLIEELLPAYHVDSMIGLHTDCAVMDTLILQNDAELHAHLKLLGLNMEILCTKWLVTCFLTSLPNWGSMQVIDMLFTRAPERDTASRVLLGVGIAIFFTLRAQLLEAKDAGEVLMAIHEYLNDKILVPGKGMLTLATRRDLTAFMNTSRGIINQLEPSIVCELRLIHKDEVLERFAAFEAKKIEMRHRIEASRQLNMSVATIKSSTSFRRRSGSYGGSGNKVGMINGAARTNSKPNIHLPDSISLDIAPYVSKAPCSERKATFSDQTSAIACAKQLQTDKTEIDIDIPSNQSLGTEEKDYVFRLEDKLYDVADLYFRGRIDEREHASIKAQIIRKSCKELNRATLAEERVNDLKHMLTFSSRLPSQGTPRTESKSDAMILERSFVKKSSVSIYRRMKKMKKSVLTIFKSNI